jgi:NlpC/P60 family putative phage cell wall peptidase
MTTHSLSRTDIVGLAREWIGTPYHHGASLKGAGTDCLGLVRGVFRELHGFEPERPEPYSGDWAEATGNEAMLAAARRHLVVVPRESARPGDILVFRLRAGAVAKHAAILSASDRMIHAQEGVPVAEVWLTPWWRRRIAGAFSFPGVE